MLQPVRHAYATRFEAGGGYDTDVPAEQDLPTACPFPDAQRSAALRQPLRRGKDPGEPGPAASWRTRTSCCWTSPPTTWTSTLPSGWRSIFDTFQGTVVTISHDRYFLDRVVTRVIEIAGRQGGVLQRQLQLLRRGEGAPLPGADEAVRKGAGQDRSSWRRRRSSCGCGLSWAMDKTYRRAISMEKRIERMRTTAKPTKARKMDARFSAAEFHGDEVLGIRSVSKSYGDKHLFEGISLKVEGGERIALHRRQRHRKVHPYQDDRGGAVSGRRAASKPAPQVKVGIPAPDHPLRPPGAGTWWRT